jgi:hypothetical protein
MSDGNASTKGEPGEDPFASGVIEVTIAESLQQDAPLTPSAELVHRLADAYALPPAAEPVLARSRATLARRAEALSAGTLPAEDEPMSATSSGPVESRLGTRAQQPPRRPVTALATAWRALAAVLIVALLGAGFYALLHGIPRPGAHPTATATRIATAPTSLACGGSSAPGTTFTAMPQPIPSLPAEEILSYLAQHAHTPAFLVGGSAPGGNWKALKYSYDPPVLVLPATYEHTAILCDYSLPNYVVSALVLS